MANVPTNCTCGAAYDSNGVCTKCGKKRPRSRGYRILHGILCAVLTLVIMLCMSTGSAVKSYIRGDRLAQGIRGSRLSDAGLPFSFKTLSEYVHDEFVEDERVSLSDVEKAVDSMDVPTFLGDKMAAYSAMLRGESDEVVTIEPDEIIKLLNNNKETLFKRCRLVIEQRDLDELQREIRGPLTVSNTIAKAAYGSPAGRALARFRIGLGGWLVGAILILLILWRWSSVMRKSGKTAASAFQALGWVILVPSTITLVLVMISGIGSLFVSDGVVGIHAMTKVLRAPFWMSSLIGIAGGFVFILIAALMARLALRKAASPKPIRPAKRQTMENLDVPAVAAREKVAKVERMRTAAAPASVSEPIVEKHCIQCGRGLPAKAGFCIYCGMQQPPMEQEPSDGKEPAPSGNDDTHAPQKTENPVENDSTNAPQKPENPTDIENS